MYADQTAECYRRALGILLVTFAGGLLLAWAPSLLNDPDSWWHIRLGSDIWTTGTLPTVETYSHTFAGKPFIAKEWLSQVIWYFTFSAGGWNAIVLATIFSLCLAVWIVYDTLSRNLKPLYAAAITVGAVFISSPTFLARPHVFTIPLALYWTSRMFRAAEAKTAPSFWLLLIVVLWANLHGSFTLAFLIAAFAFLHVLFETKLSDKPLLFRWFSFLIACPLVSLIHPYTWQALKISVLMAGGNEAMPFISEWQAFSAQLYPVHEAALLFLIGGLLLMRLRLSVAKILFVLLSLHMFLSHIRFVYVPFMLLLIVLAPDIRSQVAFLAYGTWQNQNRDAVELFLGRNLKRLSGAIATVWIAAGLIYLFFVQAKPPERIAISGALEFVQENKISGNVFNHYDFGGPLIFHGIKTFIDGRAEQLFLGGFITKFNKSAETGQETLFYDLLEIYSVSWTVLPPTDARNGLLAKRAEWTRAYSDEYAVVYSRSGLKAH
jgi:hypothetical protein